MKTKKLHFLAAVIVMVAFGWQGAYSQTHTTASDQDASLTSTASPHAVTKSSTHRYGVTLTSRSGTDNTYSWTVMTASSSYTVGAAAVAGTDYTITAGTHNSIQNIKWLRSGYYVLRIDEQNPAANGSCSGTQVSLNINVQAQALLQLFSTTDSGSCPSAAPGNVNIYLSSNGGTINYPITVHYKIGATGSALTAVVNSGLTVVVPTIGANATVDDITSDFIITGIDDASGTDYFTGATNIHKNYTAFATPQTSPISHD